VLIPIPCRGAACLTKLVPILKWSKNAAVVKVKREGERHATAMDLYSYRESIGGQRKEKRCLSGEDSDECQRAQDVRRHHARAALRESERESAR